MKKAVICTRSACKYKYHQEVNSVQNISVHHCPQCGNAGRMIMGPGQSEVIGNSCNRFTRPKFPLPELSLPINKSYLEASHRDIELLHEQAVRNSFTCIGFHGCGSISAKNILIAVRDVSEIEARGRGFAVGSLFGGIPTQWARKTKGGGGPTILRIYVRNWRAKSVERDYQWGKMDPDDNVIEDGVEMVLRTHTFNDIIALPSLGLADQSLIASNVWENCPTHSFRPDEMRTVQTIATHLNISLAELEREIENNPERIKKIAASLGLS